MQLNFNELRELLAALHQTDIAELTLKSADFELTVRKSVGGSDRISSSVAPPLVGGSGVISTDEAPSILSVANAPVVSPRIESAAKATTETGTTVTASVSTPVPAAIDKKLVEINSPMVGTFYRAPAPDEAPFVEVGDRIRTGQTVCIIEAMKLMNELEAEVSGEIVEVLVQNGEPVEYGQALMRVNPS